MSTQLLEDRVAALEEEVAHLKRDIHPPTSAEPDWLDRIFGMFADDPLYDEAERLGREYRLSLWEEREEAEANGSA